jgi:hypothetical protein
VIYSALQNQDIKQYSKKFTLHFVGLNPVLQKLGGNLRNFMVPWNIIFLQKTVIVKMVKVIVAFIEPEDLLPFLPPIVHIMCQMNPVYILISFYFKYLF